MKVIYDPETDTLDLIFRDGSVSESDELKEGIIIDYDKKGRIVSVEVLDASRHVSEPQSFKYELKTPKAAGESFLFFNVPFTPNFTSGDESLDQTVF